jgi:putative membrane protein
MAKLLNLPKWLLLTTLMTATAVACGDDDDDDDSNAGGASSAGRGGSSAGRGGSTSGSSLGGNDTGEAGNGGGGVAAGRSNGGEAGSGGAGGAEEAGAGGMAGAGGDAATAALQDAQIVLVLDTLNEGEVDEAYAALPRLAVPAVQAFAQQMVMDHSTARQTVVSAANSLQLNPTPSDVQQDLKQEAETHVTMLRETSTANLDRTYIEMQVAAHAEALALLGNLEAAADAAALRTLIGTLETAVQAHYDQAVTIRGGL